MKHIFGPEKPEFVVDGWPGQFTIFSWLEFLFTAPTIATLITTRKENGAPNACWHAGGMLTGGGDNYSSLIAVYTHYHTYANILRENEWCINFPSSGLDAKCYQTVVSNGSENDEIADAGLTAEPGQTIKAPRVAECLVNVECRLEWDRPLHEGGNMHLFCGRVTALAVDEALVTCNTEERLRALDLSYLVMGQVNPLAEGGPSSSKMLSILQHELR